MNWDLAMALSYAGTGWFVQLCVLWSAFVLIGKKSDYVLCMSIRGEQRQDEDVVRLVGAYKKELWKWMGLLFLATGGHFLLPLLPCGVDALQVLYMTLWCTAVIYVEYKVINKYTNRMYELKLQKGWGKPAREKTLEIDTIVSRMKKTMPVSELWLGIPLWICIGGFLWWSQCATEYPVLLVSMVFNVLAFVFLCYMFHRMAHGKLKVYSEDSEINYALNKAAKRAWTGLVAWLATLLCGYQFIVTVFVYSYMEKVSEGRSTEGINSFLFLFVPLSLAVTGLLVFSFIKASGKVKKVKKELALAADFTYAEDEDACWKNGYYYNPYDTNTFVESRGMGITTNMATKWGPITKWLLIGTFILCVGLAVALLPFDFGTVKAKAEADRIEVRGCLYYKENVYFEDVEEVVLLTELPESARVWGTGTDRVALGKYHLKEYGSVKLILLKEVPLYLMVKKTDGTWFGFSTKDREEMLSFYEKLKVYSD